MAPKNPKPVNNKIYSVFSVLFSTTKIIELMPIKKLFKLEVALTVLDSRPSINKKETSEVPPPAPKHPARNPEQNPIIQIIINYFYLSYLYSDQWY